MKLVIQITAASAVLAVMGSIILLATGDTKSAALGFLGAAILGLGVINTRRLAKKYAKPR